MKDYCVTYVSDKNVWKHLFVSICSLREKNKNIDIIVFFKGNINIINKTFNNNHKLNVQFKKINSEKLNLFKRDQMMFFRYLIPDIIKDYKKVLYLDCDTFIKEKIDKLLNINLSNFPLGAVKEPWQPKFLNLHIGKDFLSRFNSGVLLINIKNWKKRGITKKILSLSKQKKYINYLDQPLINFCIKKNYKSISYKWNYLSSEKNLKGIKIIHFAKKKPWILYHDSIFRSEYLYFRRKIDKYFFTENLSHIKIIKFYTKKVLNYFL